MKTIKAIILGLLLSVSSIASAQDATNDATWEETIDFLNKNKSYIKSAWGGECSAPADRIYDVKISRIENEIFILENDSNCPWIMDLSKLYNITTINCSGISGSLELIKIQLTGNYIKYDCHGTENDKMINSRYIHVNDVEMRSRIINAFKHLVYLATQKREAEAAQDKF